MEEEDGNVGSFDRWQTAARLANLLMYTGSTHSGEHEDEGQSLIEAVEQGATPEFVIEHLGQTFVQHVSAIDSAGAALQTVLRGMGVSADLHRGWAAVAERRQRQHLVRLTAILRSSLGDAAGAVLVHVQASPWSVLQRVQTERVVGRLRGYTGTFNVQLAYPTVYDAKGEAAPWDGPTLFLLTSADVPATTGLSALPQALQDRASRSLQREGQTRVLRWLACRRHTISAAPPLGLMAVHDLTVHPDAHRLPLHTLKLQRHHFSASAGLPMPASVHALHAEYTALEEKRAASTLRSLPAVVDKAASVFLAELQAGARSRRTRVHGVCVPDAHHFHHVDGETLPTFLAQQQQLVDVVLARRQEQDVARVRQYIEEIERHATALTQGKLVVPAEESAVLRVRRCLFHAVPTGARSGCVATLLGVEELRRLHQAAQAFTQRVKEDHTLTALHHVHKAGAIGAAHAAAVPLLLDCQWLEGAAQRVDSGSGAVAPARWEARARLFADAAAEQLAVCEAFEQRLHTLDISEVAQALGPMLQELQENGAERRLVQAGQRGLEDEETWTQAYSEQITSLFQTCAEADEASDRHQWASRCLQLLTRLNAHIRCFHGLVRPRELIYQTKEALQAHASEDAAAALVADRLAQLLSAAEQHDSNQELTAVEDMVRHLARHGPLHRRMHAKLVQAVALQRAFDQWVQRLRHVKHEHTKTMVRAQHVAASAATRARLSQHLKQKAHAADAQAMWTARPLQNAGLRRFQHLLTAVHEVDAVRKAAGLSVHSVHTEALSAGLELIAACVIPAVRALHLLLPSPPDEQAQRAAQQLQRQALLQRLQAVEETSHLTAVDMIEWVRVEYGEEAALALHHISGEAEHLQDVSIEQGESSAWNGLLNAACARHARVLGAFLLSQGDAATDVALFLQYCDPGSSNGYDLLHFFMTHAHALSHDAAAAEACARLFSTVPAGLAAHHPQLHATPEKEPLSYHEAREQLAKEQLARMHAPLREEAARDLEALLHSRVHNESVGRELGHLVVHPAPPNMRHMLAQHAASRGAMHVLDRVLPEEEEGEEDDDDGAL